MTATARARQRKTTSAGPRLSRLHAPPGMESSAWQVALRRQFGREQDFSLENLGPEPVFSEFRVVNPASGGRYRVAIRGTGPGDNYCSCPDFATNELGTCKHIEFTLGVLEKRRGAKTAFASGYRPPFSELYLRYGARRSVHFRPGADAPAELLAHARRLFDESADWRLAPERFGQLDAFLARTRNGHELRLYEDALDFVAQVRDAERRREVLERAYPQGARSPALRKLLKAKLLPYQAEGALFAARAGRCLIGDEMGLGKTVQAIAAAEILGRHFAAERTLVICPASLPVEPRQFTGELLHHLPASAPAPGEIYVELYLAAPDAANEVGLYRSGTRILRSITELEAFDRAPWNSGFLQGIVDAPFLNLTPATRTGVIYDAALEAFVASMAPLEARLAELIEERKRAEEEQSSRDTLRAIQRAFREAMLALPAEDYDWFDVNARRNVAARGEGAAPAAEDEAANGIAVPPESEAAQRQFFEFAGPLYSVRIAPAACTVAVGASRTLHAIVRDASRRPIAEGVACAWRLIEGGGRIENPQAEYAVYHAPEEPALVRVGVTARQGDTACEAQALITVTDSILPESRERGAGGQGLPGYTLEHAPGKLWRSRFEAEQNVIVVNSGHRDYVFAARSKALKLRYLVRLYAKEMVRRNFPELRGEELLDRLIELSLYTEEHLR